MYNPIFGQIVFNLDIEIGGIHKQSLIDFEKAFNYNILVYVLMEFREHAKILLTIII